jgi:hypothetical protein
MKKLVISKIFLTAIAGIIAAASIYLIMQANSRGPLGTSYPMASPIQDGYGFAGSFNDMTAEEINSRMSAMHAAHSNWVRFDLSWNEVQPNGAKDYDWSRYDQIVQIANQNNMNVLMIVGLTPAWARGSNCPTELCAPKDPAAYATFAAAASRHFSPLGVHSWEIWNEPNISYRFRPAANVGSYVAMLKAASVAIKQVDAKATIVAASTAPSRTDKSNYTPTDFLKGMYDHGAAGYFDAISSHPYTYPILPSKSSPYDAWGQLTVMHDLMAQHGDGTKQIWITEFGAPTNGPNKVGEYVTESEQAQFTKEAITLFRKHDWSGPFIWYGFIDTGTNKQSSEDFYGIIRADGSHKPAYDAWITSTPKL